jgi:hypothetical protein
MLAVIAGAVFLGVGLLSLAMICREGLPGVRGHGHPVHKAVAKPRKH